MRSNVRPPHSTCEDAVPAPRQRPHAGFQLLERERLGKIVVGAEVETAHAGLDAILRRQDEHSQFGAFRAEPLQHLETVHPGKAEVEDQEIELEARDRGEHFGAGGHAVDRITAFAEPCGKTIRQDGIILGNQNAHPARPQVPPRWLSCAPQPANRIRV
jgi:hypothetical protein